MMMMYYGFNRLNLDRIYGGVSAEHQASVRICEKVGLQIEGLRRGHLLRNGKRTDAHIVGALRDEWIPKYGEVAKNYFKVLPS